MVNEQGITQQELGCAETVAFLQLGIFAFEYPEAAFSQVLKRYQTIGHPADEHSFSGTQVGRRYAYGGKETGLEVRGMLERLTPDSERRVANEPTQDIQRNDPRRGIGTHVSPQAFERGSRNIGSPAIFRGKLTEDSA